MYSTVYSKKKMEPSLQYSTCTVNSSTLCVQYSTADKIVNTVKTIKNLSVPSVIYVVDNCMILNFLRVCSYTGVLMIKSM